MQKINSGYLMEDNLLKDLGYNINIISKAFVQIIQMMKQMS